MGYGRREPVGLLSMQYDSLGWNQVILGYSHHFIDNKCTVITFWQVKTSVSAFIEPLKGIVEDRKRMYTYNLYSWTYLNKIEHFTEEFAF